MPRPDAAGAVRDRRRTVQRLLRRLDRGVEHPTVGRVRDAVDGWDAEYTRLLTSDRETIRDLRRRLRSQRLEATRLQGVVQEVRSLQDLAARVRCARRPGDILRTLRTCVARIVSVEDCELFYLVGDPPRLQPHRRRRVSDRLWRTLQADLEEGVVDWVLQTRRPAVIPDLETLPTAGGGETRCFILVPIVLKGEGTGMYVIATDQRKDAVTPEALETLMLLTEHAAVGIAHLRLVKRGGTAVPDAEASVRKRRGT